MIEVLKTFINFPFRGPDWKSRFITGSALVLGGFIIPVIPFIFVLGYVLEIMRRVIQGEEPSLPPWENFGKLAADGIKGFIASLVYLLPGLAFIIGGYIFYFIVLFVSPQGGEALLAYLIGMALFMAGLFLGLILLTLGSIPLPAALAHLAARGNVGAAFEVSGWWALIRSNPWGYFAAWVVTVGVAYIGYWLAILPFYTVILCCFSYLLWAPVLFYALVVSGALFAQFYRESSLSTREIE